MAKQRKLKDKLRLFGWSLVVIAGASIGLGILAAISPAIDGFVITALVVINLGWIAWAYLKDSAR